MRRVARSLALATVLVAPALGFQMLTASPAAAWTRHSTFVGSRGGVWNHNASGGCAGGTCTRSGSTVGPRGGVWSSNGSVTRTAPGQVSRSGTVTGPGGNSYYHQGTRSCADGSCTSTHTVTRQ